MGTSLEGQREILGLWYANDLTAGESSSWWANVLIERPRLADHQRQWREVIAFIVRADCDRLGIEPPIPIDDAAQMILAMDNSYLLSQMIEPGSYAPGACLCRI